jgi:hypothetical protein
VLNARLILGRLVRVLATALARANPALSHPAASILLPARSSATLTLSIAPPPSQVMTAPEMKRASASCRDASGPRNASACGAAVGRRSESPAHRARGRGMVDHVDMPVASPKKVAGSGRSFR